MWAGAGVGGLRTPARCLDSNIGYPLRPAAKRRPEHRNSRLPIAGSRCEFGEQTSVASGSARDAHGDQAEVVGQLAAR